MHSYDNVDKRYQMVCLDSFPDPDPQKPNADPNIRNNILLKYKFTRIIILPTDQVPLPNLLDPDPVTGLM